jgi:serine/threonine protein kinase
MTEEEIFHQALARRDPEERAAYLEQACGDDAALRASIEALLRADVGATGFMERPQQDSDATADAPIGERPGTVIGPYKLLQEIGEGGMGTVFMAEQMEPVRRKVALKLIRPGMDSRRILARFEAERQALAMMDHPNIAKVLDAGYTGVRSQEQGVRNQESARLEFVRGPRLLTAVP